MRLASTILIFAVGALLALGLVTLYSAGLVKDSHPYQGSHYFVMQAIYAVAGLGIAGVLAAFVDYRWLKHSAWPLLIVALILLAGVLLFGHKVNGGRRWFRQGGISFQPSELAKLAVIIVLAYYGDRYKRYMPTFWRGLIIPGCILGSVLALIFIEPDRGTTILLATVGGMMLLLAGIRVWYLIPPIVIGAAGLAYSILHDPVRYGRIMSWLHPEDHKQGGGYQVHHSILGIASGGVDGLGLGNGRQKVLLPERHTDFVFAVTGEEMGLIATLGTLVAYAALIICGTYVARRARDTFGFLLASGITFLIGLQAAINIGVVTGAIPNKGLSLPFLSYGGSNLLLMLACVGILLSVGRKAREEREVFTEKNPFGQ